MDDNLYSNNKYLHVMNVILWVLILLPLAHVITSIRWTWGRIKEVWK